MSETIITKFCKRCNCFTEWSESRECRPCKRARESIRRLATREQRREYGRKRVLFLKATNPEALKEKRRADYQKGKEKLAAARKEKLEWLRDGKLTSADLRAIADKWGHKCAYCGTPVVVTCYPSWPVGFDHVIPKSKGGLHTVSNLVVACQPCNLSKHNLLLEEWEERKARLTEIDRSFESAAIDSAQRQEGKK